jgi:2-phosphosulfolactate phosphatase
MAETLYSEAKDDHFEFMKSKDASHYHRLMNYGLEEDIRYCFKKDVDNVLPIYDSGRLIVKKL